MAAFLERRFSWLLLILCILVTAWFLLWNLWELPFFVWDEPQYASIELHILQSHDWFHLVDWMRPFFEKPPLQMWLGAFFMMFIGPFELAARLPSALSGIATVAILCVWARERAQSMWSMPLIVVLFCTSQLYFTHSFRSADTDALTAFLITASLYCYDRSKQSPLVIIACGGFLGLLTMTKSVEVLVPLIIMAGDSMLTGSWKQVHRRNAGIAVLLWCAIVIPWHVAMSIAYGQAFWASYFGMHIFDRWTSVVQSPHTEWNYYWGVNQWMLYPVNFIVYPALIWQLRGLLRDRVRDARLLWVLWFAIGELIITTSLTKQPWYVVPFCIPLYLIVADAIVGWWKSAATDWLAILSIAWIALCALIARPCTAASCTGIVTALGQNNPLSMAVIVIVCAAVIGKLFTKFSPRSLASFPNRVFLVAALAMLLYPIFVQNIHTINAQTLLPGGERDLAAFLMQQPGSGKTLIIPWEFPYPDRRLGEFYWEREKPALTIIDAPTPKELQQDSIKPHTFILRLIHDSGALLPGYHPIYTWSDVELLGR